MIIQMPNKVEARKAKIATPIIRRSKVTEELLYFKNIFADYKRIQECKIRDYEEKSGYFNQETHDHLMYIFDFLEKRHIDKLIALSEQQDKTAIYNARK